MLPCCSLNLGLSDKVVWINITCYQIVMPKQPEFRSDFESVTKSCIQCLVPQYDILFFLQLDVTQGYHTFFIIWPHLELVLVIYSGYGKND